jgi:uncharacterized phage-associated protein
MTTIYDIAAYALQRRGSRMTTWELQKLCYYAQAWSLAVHARPLFNEEFQAWKDGPVQPELYQRHKGAFSVTEVAGGDASKVAPDDAGLVDRVLEFYSRFTPGELRELSHRERPWRAPRGGLAGDAPSKAVITHASMQDYFAPLAPFMSAPERYDALERGARLLLSMPEDQVDSLFEPADVDGDRLASWLANGGDSPWPSDG